MYRKEKEEKSQRRASLFFFAFVLKRKFFSFFFFFEIFTERKCLGFIQNPKWKVQDKKTFKREGGGNRLH